MKKILFYIIFGLSLCFSDAFAQLDVVHYIPPFYASAVVGDQTIVLSTKSPTDITVTIERGGVVVFSEVINKDSPAIVPLGTGYDNDGASKTGVINFGNLNSANDLGWKLTSDEPFYCSVYQKSDQQGDILTTKGSAALGTEFYTGHAKSTGTKTQAAIFTSFMATENDTKITVTNPRVLYDGKTTNSFEVTLQAGESYVIGKKYAAGVNFNDYNGTHIVSDKPIAVNSGNWMASQTSGSMDVAIDQLVPIDYVGTEYIIVRGEGLLNKGDAPAEQAIVTSTTDNNVIKVNDSIVATLDAGEYYIIEEPLYGTSENLRITSDDKIYVTQTLSGDVSPATIGMCFIPPLPLESSLEDISINTNDIESSLSLISRKGATIKINGITVDPAIYVPTDVVGNADWQTFKISELSTTPFYNGTDNYNITSDMSINASISLVKGVMGGGGFFSGFSNPIVPIPNDTTLYLDLNGNVSVTAIAIDSASYVTIGDLDSVTIGAVDLREMNFDCSHVGVVQEVIFRAWNNGLYEEDTSLVTVLDTMTSLVALARDTVLYLDGAQSASITAISIDSGSTAGGCSGVIDNVMLSDSVFDCSHVGAPFTLEFYARSGGNIDTTNFTVTVLDTLSSLTAIAKNDTLYLDNSQYARLDSAQLDNGSSSGGCTGVLDSITQDTIEFGCSDIGEINWVVLRAWSGGVADVDSAMVTILDTISTPIAVAKDDTVYLNGTGHVEIDSANVDGGSTATGCAPLDSISFNPKEFECIHAGGRHKVIVTAWEGVNTDTAHAFITVLDTFVSVTAIAKNIDLYLDALGDASIDSSDINDGSSAGGCGAVIDSIVLSKEDFICDDLGTDSVQMVVWSNGSSDTATSVVTVIDTFASVEAVANNVFIYLDTAFRAEVDSALMDGGSSVTGCAELDSISLNPTKFDCAHVGAINAVQLIAWSGVLSDTTMGYVSIIDTVSQPNAIAKDDTVYLDAGFSASITPADVDDGSWAAGCAPLDSLSIDSSFFNCSHVGTKQRVVLTAWEGANIDTAHAFITVLDTFVSVMAIAKDIDLHLDALGDASIDSSDINDGSSAGGCGAIIDSIVLSKEDFICDDLGLNSVQMVVWSNGSSDTATSVVTVIDTFATVVAQAKDTTIYLDTMFEAKLDSPYIDNHSFTTGCASLDSVSLTPAIFYCGNVGLNQVALVAWSDGVSDTAYANVTVIDTISTPTAVAKDDTVYLDAGHAASITVADVDDGSFALGCAPLDSLSIDSSFFNCSHVGTKQRVVLTAYEGANTDTAHTFITILDTFNTPVPLGEDFTLYLDATFNATIDSADIDKGSYSRACTPIDSVSLSPTAFTCSDVGDVPVTLTAWKNGVSADTVITVTVIDTISPVAQAQDIPIYLGVTKQASIVASQLDNGSYTDCGTIDSVSIDIKNFDCDHLGTNTVTLTAWKGATSSTATATVTVYDTVGYCTPPIAPDYFYETYNTHIIKDDVSKAVYDPDGEAVSINTSPVMNPKHGSVTINADGSFVYTPSGSIIVRADSFAYEVCDAANCTAGVVYITVDKEPQVILLTAEYKCEMPNPFPITYTTLDAAPDKYSIRYDNDEIALGFSEFVRDDIVTVGQLSVDIPSDVPEATYSPLFMFEEDTVRVKVIPADIMVEYPLDILVQKWNNVIAILSEPFNGGYEFVYFQWYDDGRPMVGETGEYLHIDPDLPMDTVSEFSVHLTRPDGVKMETCPIQFVPRTLQGAYPTQAGTVVQSYVSPTLVRPSSSFAVTVPNKAGNIRVLDTQGSVELETTVQGVNTMVLSPSRSGVYLVEVTDDSGRSVHRLVVQ